MNSFAEFWRTKHINRQELPFLKVEEMLAAAGLPPEYISCGAEALSPEAASSPSVKAPISPGEIIQLALDHVQLTQAELGKGLGVGRSMVTQLIHNQRGITVENALVIEDMLRIPAHFLLRLQADYNLYRARHK